ILKRCARALACTLQLAASSRPRIRRAPIHTVTSCDSTGSPVVRFYETNRQLAWVRVSADFQPGKERKMSASLTSRRRALGLAAATTFALTLLAAVPISSAQEHWREHEFREHEFHDRAYFDARYHHDHYYPPAGFAFGALPPGYVAVRHGGVSF